jgi:hypothetical protein
MNIIPKKEFLLSGKKIKRMMNNFIKYIVSIIILVSCLIGQDRYKTFPTWVKSVPSYGINGMKNSVTLKSNLLVIGAAGLGAIIAYQYDDKVQNYEQSEGLLPERVSQIGDLYGGIWSAWLLPASIIITSKVNDESNRQMLEKLEYAASALVANCVTTVILKELIGRERPNGTNNRSMPSGHTSHSFTVAAVANELYGHTVGIATYMLAGLVAASRIHDNKHYMSDVIVGAGLGTIIGRGFAKTFTQNKAKTNIQVGYNRLILSYNF